MLPVVVLPVVVLPVVVLPDVDPLVEPEVEVLVPDVDPLVEPEVEVLIPEVEPLVEPEVEVLIPEVEPEVEPAVLIPEVDPLVEPAVVPPVFSVAVQLTRVSDEQRSALVSAESHLRFIRKGRKWKKCRMRLLEYTGPSRKIYTGFSTGKNGFIVLLGHCRARRGPAVHTRRVPRGWAAPTGSRATTSPSYR